MITGKPEGADISQEPKTIWNRSFIILFFANMAFNMGLSMSNALLPVYADHLGATAAVVGLVISSFSISSILLRLISAPIMDAYNRKHLVIIAALMMSAAFLGFSISTNIPMLVCFRLLQGCSMAFGNACCLVMVADMLPKDKYNSGLGYFSLAMVVSTAIAPSIGLELVKLSGYRVTYIFAACFMLFACFLTFLVKTSFTRSKKLELSFDNIIAREALLPSVVQFLLALPGACVMSFLFLFAAEQGVTGNIGLYFTVSAATMLITRPIIGRFTDKFGVVKISVPAILCTILSIFIISRAATLIAFLFAAFISAFGQGALTPAIQALTMKSVPNERRGAASCTNYISQDAGALLGPVIAGQIIRLSGYISMWRIMMIPVFTSALILIVFRSKVIHIEEDFAAR